MIKHLNIKVTGDVQGVFFRATAREQAARLHITGFARNDSDGSVYIEAEGEEDQLTDFINWCRIGPNSANVKNVVTSPGTVQNFQSFETG